MNYLRWVEIDLGAIKSNVQQIKKVIEQNVDLIAVVKANAYGHGLVEISKKALVAGAGRLAVFNFEEALKLRKAGIKKPILVLGYVLPEDLKEAIKNKITLSLYDIETAKKMFSVAKKLGTKALVQIKVDTGMHRLGVSYKIGEFFEKIKNFEGLEIEGVFSHFADSTNKEYSEFQLKRFKKALEDLKKEGINPKVIHMSNSAGALTIKEARFNAVRCGIGIYGLSPFLKNSAPALSFRARVIQVKDIEKGDFVGYQRTYKAQKPTKIAVLGVGYADGYDRALSNKGEVLLKGIRCPVIGRICMNQTIIALNSRLKEIKIGDKVTLIGEDGNDRITVEEIAEKLNTIPHEVVSRIPENVPRLYHD